ncbi:hypothetical protein [Marinoscillum pacificum]|uniref:hypothetical protein n=1 Tax=Marinoscillum pacificum TaxID=392723 RepID=UPI0021577EF7|nr:hypothetical protein [Marinoscillum pacificum]
MNNSKNIDTMEEAIALKIAMHLERNIAKSHNDTLSAKRYSDMSNYIQTEFLKTIDA